MQDVEKELADVSQSKQNPLVQQIVVQLNDAVVYSQGGNSEVNRKLWNNYAREWAVEKPWVKKMASDVSMDHQLASVGDEWAPREHTIEVIQHFIFPHVSGLSVVGEVGVGGGRISVEVFHKVREFYGYDISSEMLKRASANIAAAHGEGSSLPASVHLTLLTPEDQCLRKSDFFDFLYSFDVFPHVDSHVLFNYLKEFQKALKPGGLAFFSTSDITSPGGWERFEKQKFSTVGGFCFTSPQIVHHLVEKAGLEVVSCSSPADAATKHNVYYNRDLLILVRKPRPVDA